MKLNKIAAMCRKYKSIVLVHESENRQWIGSPYALYRLDGLPQINEAGAYALLDVPEKDKGKCRVVGADAKSLPLADLSAFEDRSRVINLKLCINGFSAMKTSQGVTFIDERLLAPLTDEAAEIEIFERHDAGGGIIFAVMNGMCLRAIIYPVDVIDDEYCEKITELAQLVSVALSMKKDRAVRPVSGKGAHVDYDGEQLDI